MSKFLDLDSDIVIPGPLLSFADNKPIVAPAPFADAIEHWRFGGSAASRVGLINGLPLRLGMGSTAAGGGTGYTSAPAVALSGAGAVGLTGFAEASSGGAVGPGGISGQPIDDTSGVTAVLSGGGGTGATLTYARGVEPTYNDKSAIIPAGRLNGLISSINDAVVYSEAYLVKRPAAGAVQHIGGTMLSIARLRTTAVGGDLLQWNGDLLRHLTATGGTISTAPPASWAVGAWGVAFVAQTASSRTLMAFGPDGASTKVTGAQAKTLANPIRKRAIGGLHYDTGSDYLALEIASFVPFVAALSEATMANRAYDLLDYARDAGLIA